MKFIVVFLTFYLISFADYTLDLASNVMSLKLDKNNLIIGLDNGELYKYSIENKELKKMIELPKISNYFQKDISPKIFSIDSYDGMIAILFEGDGGKKRLGILNGKFETFDLPAEGVKKIFLLNKNIAILLTLSSEIQYFDFTKQQIVFKTKLTSSGFGDADFDRNESLLVTGCEGGLLFYFDTNQKKVLKTVPVQKDSIYSVGLYKNMVISGSADKSCYYYNGKMAHYFNANFLVYSVGISKDYAAFSTEDEIMVVDKNGNLARNIAYNNGSLNFLIFFNNYLIGSSYDRVIYFWSLK